MKFITAALAAVAYAAPEEDRVTELPEMGKFDTYGAFSGFLDIPDTSKKLHYLFFEAQENAADAPVLIWFNGGPGCSSMLGFLQEHGPFVMDNGKSDFRKNPYSWNKEANILYIEQPAGVGYSFCDRNVGANDCTFDDNNAATDNLYVMM